MMVDDFKQFSDIDFKDVPQNIKLFFEKLEVVLLIKDGCCGLLDKKSVNI